MTDEQVQHVVNSITLGCLSISIVIYIVGIIIHNDIKK